MVQTVKKVNREAESEVKIHLLYFIRGRRMGMVRKEEKERRKEWGKEETK